MSIEASKYFSIICQACEKDKAWPYQTKISVKSMEQEVIYECSNGHAEITREKGDIGEALGPSRQG